MISKITILLLFIQLNLFAQNINHIEYKKECDIAYRAALDQKEHQSCIIQLHTIKKKYNVLFCEEYILMAFCYKKLNQYTKSAQALQDGWSTYAFDINSINQIEELDSETICKGFSKHQLEIVRKGYKNSEKLKNKVSDSLVKVFQLIDRLDNKLRTKLEQNLKDSVKIKSEIRFVDSINMLIFKNIINEFGYPGEYLIPQNTGYPFLILTHSANYTSFYNQMQPILLNEVKNGRMPPSHYVFWIDRYNEAHNLPLEYGILCNASQMKFTDLEKIEIQKKRLELGLIKHFPIPSLQITSK